MCDGGGGLFCVEQQVDCSAGPQLVPSLRPRTLLRADGAKFILVVEKEAVFSGLIDAGFMERFDIAPPPLPASLSRPVERALGQKSSPLIEPRILDNVVVPCRLSAKFT
jgi:hypothetical protein